MFELASNQEVEFSNSLILSILKSRHDCQIKDIVWCFGAGGNHPRETYVLPVDHYTNLFVSFLDNDSKFISSFAISEKSDFIAPDIEINIQKIQEGSKTEGRIVKDEKNNLFLAHKGGITARKKIAAQKTFSYFEQMASLELIQVNETQLIKAAHLDEKQFIPDIIKFTLEIKSMKELFKAALNDSIIHRAADILEKTPHAESAAHAQSDHEIDSPLLEETMREASVQVRIGQRIFRNNLLKINNSTCQVTGIKLPALLKASHIKPWCESNNEERLDFNNGLLLASHIDTLFDQGFISFNDDGALIFATPEIKTLFDEQNIPYQQINLNKQSLKYIKWHRNNIFKGSLEM